MPNYRRLRLFRRNTVLNFIIFSHEIMPFILFSCHFCRAARHGLTLNGKLHRIELQEQRILGLQNDKRDLTSEDVTKKLLGKDYSRKKKRNKCS